MRCTGTNVDTADLLRDHVTVKRPRTHNSDSDAAPDPTDQTLLDRTIAGDREAFRALYRRYYNSLLRFIYRITGQLELAQEGVNDTMLVVWQKGDSFNARSAVATWIMGIAYRKALKLAEKSKRWSERVSSVDFESWVEPFGDAAGHTYTPEVRDLLDRALKQLPAEQRAVVELTYFYGCSYREIADIAGCPVNTVKTRMFHARAKLKKLLSALDSELPL